MKVKSEVGGMRRGRKKSFISSSKGKHIEEDIKIKRTKWK
jgi:hypothetical protein